MTPKRSRPATLSRSRFSAAMAMLLSSLSSSSSSSSSSLIAATFSVKIHQAVDDVVDLELVALDLGGEVEDLRDRHRARRDRHDHVLEAILDPLGDFDFAFAREEFDRAHFAHVHAYRVGGAAELGVERRCRGFGGFFVDVVGGGRGRGFRHQQRFGVRRLVVDLDPHVVDHGDDALDLFGVEDVVGQVVVDLGVRQVAALLAEHDQIFQARLARLGFGRRQLDLAQVDAAVLAACLAFGERLFRAARRKTSGDLTRRRLDRRRGLRLGGSLAVGLGGYRLGGRFRGNLGRHLVGGGLRERLGVRLGGDRLERLAFGGWTLRDRLLRLACRGLRRSLALGGLARAARRMCRLRRMPLGGPG